MEKQKADRIITEYVNKLFGFALSKTNNISQAEELASTITLEVYTSLLKRDNILNLNGYIYRVAQNVYARFLDKTKGSMHLSLDEVNYPAEDNYIEAIAESETYRLIRREIAYLTKTQRDIVVMHYYDRMKLSEIAEKLHLPTGTVKWHLYEAKSNLKEGMNIMRQTGNLGLKPVKLIHMGHNGSAGKLGDTSDFLKKRLTQNIAYAAYWNPKSINEIAQELNVSPLFIEDEVNTLEEYGFMDKVAGDKYLTNIYITEQTKETAEKEHVLYNQYAKIVCEKYVPLVVDYLKNFDKTKLYIPDNDFNLLLWSVIPFACGFKLYYYEDHGWDAHFVKRKDGGEYTAFASVATDYTVSFEKRKYHICGNMTRESLKNYPISTWQIDTYYDGRVGAWCECLASDFDDLYEFIKGTLKKENSQIEKFQRLYEKGYLTPDDQVNLIVVKEENGKYLTEANFTKNLPGITDELKEAGDKLDHEIYEINKDLYPKHMQDLTKSWSSNCLSGNNIRSRVLEQLLDSGVLKMPAEERRAGLTTLLFSDVLPK